MRYNQSLKQRPEAFQDFNFIYNALESDIMQGKMASGCFEVWTSYFFIIDDCSTANQINVILACQINADKEIMST